MSYLGNSPTSQNFLSGSMFFSGNGSTTTFTLNRTVSSTNDILVMVGTAVSAPNTYTVSGTTLTFNTAPVSGTNNICVRYLSTTTFTVDVSDQSVNTAKIQDSAITAAKLAVGATGTISWVAINNSAGAAAWVKLCTVSGAANDRATIFLSGVPGYGAQSDDTAGGATLYYTLGNDSNANNLNLSVVNSSSASPSVTAVYAVRGASDYIWDIWVYVSVYTRLNAMAFGNVYTITNTYTDVNQSSKPTGGYDKKVGRDVTSLTPGTILQVSSARTGEYFTTSSQSWVDITNLTQTITPMSTTSRILIFVNFGKLGVASYNLDYVAIFRVLRNGSDDVAINGTAAGSRTKICALVNGYQYNSDHAVGGLSCQAIDSPASTSALTYKVQVLCQGSAQFFTLNRSINNGDSANPWHATSQASITLMEIA